MEGKKHKWPQTAMRLTDLARETLRRLAEREGTTLTKVVERLLREEGRRKKIGMGEEIS